MNTQETTNESSGESKRKWKIPSYHKRKDQFFGGRPRKGIEERTITVNLCIKIDTFKRIENLRKRLMITRADAVEMLMKTADAEKIEPTPEIDWTIYAPKANYYSLAEMILGKHLTKALPLPSGKGTPARGKVPAKPEHTIGVVDSGEAAGGDFDSTNDQAPL